MLTTAVHKTFISQLFSIFKVHDELWLTQEACTLSKTVKVFGMKWK